MWTPLLENTLSFGHPICTPWAFFNSKYLLMLSFCFLFVFVYVTGNYRHDNRNFTSQTPIVKYSIFFSLVRGFALMKVYTVNVKNFVVETFSLYLRAPLHCENIVCEMSPCFSRVTLWSIRYGPSPLLPASCVFTRHCRAVVSSLSTANGPLRHSSVCVTV